MTNAPEPWAGYPDYQPGTGAQPQSRSAVDAAKALWGAVALLGLVSVGAGFAAPVPLEFAVRFAAAAAVVAAVGLLPRQSSHGWLVVTLAAVGFFDALTMVVTGVDGGWPLIVVLVVDALQALLAVAALIVIARVEGALDDAASVDGAAAENAESSRGYAYGEAPLQQPSGPPGAARVRAPRAAGALADAAQGSYAAMQGAPPQHYQRAPATPQGPRAGASDAANPGLPGAHFGASPASPVTRPGGPPGESPPR